MIYRCKLCGKRIPEVVAVIALSRGREPAYCSPTHRNAGRQRIKRANKKAKD